MQAWHLESLSLDSTLAPRSQAVWSRIWCPPPPIRFLNDKEELVGEAHYDARESPGIVFAPMYSFEQFAKVKSFNHTQTTVSFHSHSPLCHWSHHTLVVLSTPWQTALEKQHLVWIWWVLLCGSPLPCSANRQEEEGFPEFTMVPASWGCCWAGVVLRVL